MIRTGCLIIAFALTGSTSGAQTTLPAIAKPPINCTINPLQTVEISAAVSGIVAEVMVRPGMEVSTGDIIAKLDTSLAEADLEIAQARANFSGAIEAALIQRDSLERRAGMLKQAVEERAISRAEYESILLEYELSKATVQQQIQDQQLAQREADRAKLVLEKAIIRATVDGIVGENLIDVGENVINRPIATIYVTRPMRVEAFVPVADLRTIAEQTNPQIIVDGNTDNPVPVSLDYVSPVANLSSNTISVYFSLESDTIIPGYKCTLARPN